MNAADHKNEIAIAAWLVISQCVMLLLGSGILLEQAQAIASELESYLPTLRRMKNDNLFDVGIAKAQAAIMFCLVPLLSFGFFAIPAKSVRAQLKYTDTGTVSVIMVFYTALLVAIAFLGMNVRGPGSLFELHSWGFAILSAFMTIFPAYYIRMFSAFVFCK